MSGILLKRSKANTTITHIAPVLEIFLSCTHKYWSSSQYLGMILLAICFPVSLYHSFPLVPLSSSPPWKIHAGGKQ